MWKSRIINGYYFEEFCINYIFPFDLGTYISNDYAIKRDINHGLSVFLYSSITVNDLKLI